MKDKAFNIFLMLLIGTPGLAILVIACIRPMPSVERIMTICIGLIGLFFVFARALLLKSIPAETSVERVLVESPEQNEPY